MPPAKKSTANRPAKRTGAKKAPAKKMSTAHKRALATGRTEARHVRAYLDALEAHKPRRGRQRTPETIRKQLTQVEAELRSATGFRKLELAARRLELRADLDTKRAGGDLSGLRRNFVRHAGKYAARKGIPKQAFQEAGVPAADIREAGIK